MMERMQSYWPNEWERSGFKVDQSKGYDILSLWEETSTVIQQGKCVCGGVGSIK